MLHTDASWSEQYRVRCADGRSISLYRYLSKTTPLKDRQPLLLCAGLGANIRNMDFEEGRSLAVFLREEGYDVWVIALRGTENTAWAQPSGRRWDITFEDFVQYDAPAAIHHILSTTDAPRVHWVGHSMGGLLGASLAQGDAKPFIASLTLLAAPSSLDLPTWLTSLASYHRPLLGWFPFVPMRALAGLAAPFVFPNPLRKASDRTPSTSPSALRRALVTIFADIPTSLLQQFARWAERGSWPSPRLGRPIASGYASIEVPLLCISAEHDPVAPPHVVREMVDQASSSQKSYLNVGDEGPSREMEYTHDDLLIGAYAYRDVFPHIVEWIEELEDPQPILKELRAPLPHTTPDAHPKISAQLVDTGDDETLLEREPLEGTQPETGAKMLDPTAWDSAVETPSFDSEDDASYEEVEDKEERAEVTPDHGELEEKKSASTRSNVRDWREPQEATQHANRPAERPQRLVRSRISGDPFLEDLKDAALRHDDPNSDRTVDPKPSTPNVSPKDDEHG